MHIVQCPSTIDCFGANKWWRSCRKRVNFFDLSGAIYTKSVAMYTKFEDDRLQNLVAMSAL